MNKKCFWISLFIFLLSSFLAYKLYINELVQSNVSLEKFGILNDKIIYRIDLDGEIYFGIKLQVECSLFKNQSVRILSDMNNNLFYFINIVTNTKGEKKHLNDLINLISLKVIKKEKERIILSDDNHRYTIYINGCNSNIVYDSIARTTKEK